MGEQWERLRTKQDAIQLVDLFDSYIFDCDGVIWQGTHLLPGVHQFLKGLLSKGKKIFFVTNNASKSRKEYREKFLQMGLDFVQSENIHGTANATAEFLATQENPKIKKVFCIGLKGFYQELNLSGIQVVGIEKETNNLEELADMELDPEVNAVVVGMDNTFSYPKLATAGLYIRYNKNCKFIATNLDSGSIQGKIEREVDQDQIFEGEGSLEDFGEESVQDVNQGTYRKKRKLRGRFIAGTGCLVSAVEVAAGRKPDFVIGKPNEWWINHIIELNNLDRKRTIMIGDRLDTDILFAKQGKIQSILVLTGVTRNESEIIEPYLPNYVADGISILAQAFEE